MLGTVMAHMMFIWDYILTFGMEVDLIWKSKWNFMEGLYLFQRYLPFIELFCLSFLVSPMLFLSSYTQLFFIVHMGEILRETGCQKIQYAVGGS